MTLDALVMEAADQCRSTAVALRGARAPAKTVHHLRTALRRLDAAVKAYRPLLGEPETQSMRRLLRSLRRLAGACRDCDVGLEVIGKWRRKRVVCRGLAGWLRERRAETAARLRAADPGRVGVRLTEE